MPYFKINRALLLAALVCLSASQPGSHGGTSGPSTNQVCLIVPPDVEQCYMQFMGKPIDNRAAQVNCLQVRANKSAIPELRHCKQNNKSRPI